MIKEQLEQERFCFMSGSNKSFVVQMTLALEALGFTYNDDIVDGICWGKYMLIFRKAGVKSKKVVARIYIREKSVAFRLFLSDVTKHADFILAAPGHIRDVFIGESGNCSHCRGEMCRFRKCYELAGEKIEKCNGEVFTFADASVEKIPDYLALFKEFYLPKRPA